MTPEEIIEACQKQIALVGPEASVTLRIPGRWGNRNEKRLCKGGPVGRIVADDFGQPSYKPRVVVVFRAQDVLNFLHEARRREG